MMYKSKLTTTQLETLLEQLKMRSINSKTYLDVYTKMVHSNAFKDNNIKNVINYVPFILDENGEPVISEANVNENPFAANLSSDTIQRISNGTDDIIPTLTEEVMLFEEDNTLSEIINQKLISFRRGTILPQLNEDAALYKKAGQGLKKILDNFITQAAESITSNSDNIMRMITNSKYYPYAGYIFMPISYIKDIDNGDMKSVNRKNHRKIEVNPFSLDIDTSTSDIDKAEWAIVTEKITFKQFRERILNGEYSYIEHDVKEKTIKDKWNKENSYKFTCKSFVEQAVTRNNSLLESSFGSPKVDKKGEPLTEDFNLFGVIEYMWLKNLEGQWEITTFLNGNAIGCTSVDSSIDTLPIVLFSESPDIDKDLDFNGNLSFKLLAPQLTILDLNHKKKAASSTMAPIVTNVFVSDETQADDSKENTDMVTSGNQISLLTVGVSNPSQANNTTRILLGSQVYTAYLKELDELINVARSNMQLKAGITSFTQGTESGSFNSQAGLDAMKVAGLEGEQDVVKAIERSITKMAIMEAYFALLNLTHSQHAKKNNTGIANEYRTNLSTALTNYKDILTFGLETRYEEQFTQSLLQSVILPLSAQTGHLDVTLNLIKNLPVTSDMKTAIDGAVATLKKKEQDAQQAEQQQIAESNGAPQGNNNAGGSGSKPASKATTKNPASNKDNKSGTAKPAKDTKTTKTGK